MEEMLCDLLGEKKTNIDCAKQDCRDLVVTASNVGLVQYFLGKHSSASHANCLLSNLWMTDESEGGYFFVPTHGCHGEKLRIGRPYSVCV